MGEPINRWRRSYMEDVANDPETTTEMPSEAEALVSIAISLKRIANVLDQKGSPYTAYVGDGAGHGFEGLGR